MAEAGTAGRAAPAENMAPAGNTATGTLKVIALFFMLIDHLGVVVFPRVEELRILGRIAFPLYCWCMVVGFHYTRSVPRYLGRILAVGILSQPLYAYVMNHMGKSGILIQDLFLTKPNIFLTLFLALAALWGIRERKYLSQIWAPALAIVLATVTGADYGWKGVLFILLLYAARNTRSGIAAVMIAYFLFWGTFYTQTKSLFGIPVALSKMPGWLETMTGQMTKEMQAGVQRLWNGITTPMTSLLRMETYGLMAMPFILIPFRKNIRLRGWTGYLLYPAHLLVVLLFRFLFGRI